LVVYDKSYDNEQVNSKFFQQHLNIVADMLEDKIGKKSIVEVGCGKGLFLEILLNRGFDIYGFDPTYTGENSRIIKEFFKHGIIKEPVACIVLRHVLEHIENPFVFLNELKIANGGEGLIYIEVPCFDWICKNHTYFDIFYEHVNYFREIDFLRMFSKIIKSGSFFGNQYLYVIADLASLAEPVNEKVDLVDFPINFLDGLLNFAKENSETPICVWGAGSKGVIFSLLLMRNGFKIEVVIEINPAKQGKYLPLTGLLVHSPEEGLKNFDENNIIYVMNSNYLDEIKLFTNNKFKYLVVDNLF
jgi:SAM-dependent methyltransferase